MGEPTATDFVPSERSGPALVLGIGSQFAGYGAHLAYYLQRRNADNASVFYAGAGVLMILAAGIALYNGRQFRKP